MLIYVTGVNNLCILCNREIFFSNFYLEMSRLTCEWLINEAADLVLETAHLDCVFKQILSYNGRTGVAIFINLVRLSQFSGQ